MTRRIKQIILCLFVLLAFPALWMMRYEHKQFTCLRCRLDKKVETYWWIPLTAYSTNSCSTWYAAGHPNHKHDWKKTSCTRGRNLFTAYYKCGKGHPVFGLASDVQKIYLSKRNEQQQESWFALLESKNYAESDKAIADAYEEAISQQAISRTNTNSSTK